MTLPYDRKTSYFNSIQSLNRFLLEIAINPDITLVDYYPLPQSTSSYAAEYLEYNSTTQEICFLLVPDSKYITSKRSLVDMGSNIISTRSKSDMIRITYIREK